MLPITVRHRPGCYCAPRETKASGLEAAPLGQGRETMEFVQVLELAFLATLAVALFAEPVADTMANARTYKAA